MDSITGTTVGQSNQMKRLSRMVCGTAGNYNDTCGDAPTARRPAPQLALSHPQRLLYNHVCVPPRFLPRGFGPPVPDAPNLHARHGDVSRMADPVKNIALFGSTGSIGASTLEVVAASQGRLQVAALSAHANTALALKQARQFRPRWLLITDSEAAGGQDWSDLPRETELIVGPEAPVQIAQRPEIDLVVAAIVGSAGLPSTWAAVEAGKTVALANKEALVVAGSLVMPLAARSGARILPIDSEHSAVFQVLQGSRRDELRRVILTASGGPFRDYTREQLAAVTVEQALAHPTWDMGPKITIDSATMMNKALEIIEARWLFDLSADQIDVVIHPQSIVHSLVEFVDGAVLAQLSPPDMRLPIQYALDFPHRRPGVAERVDFGQPFALQFAPPDGQWFDALHLGLEAARQGGTLGAVLNAANEAAVGEFLARRLPFDQIVPACRRMIEQHPFDPNPTLEQLLALDRWARQEVLRWTSR
jgi:1-deoxy-D-xylulose-5-phosphate reductoisomerase